RRTRRRRRRRRSARGRRARAAGRFHRPRGRARRRAPRARDPDLGRCRRGASRALQGIDVRLRRPRFSELIDRQLDLFERENRGLIDDCVAAERSYNRADRDEAEERYGDYVDLVETGTEVLADLRDNFATTLEDDAADEYIAAFNRAVLKRFRRFALEIEDR